MMLNNIFIVVLLISIFSCNDNDDCCSNIEATLLIVMKDTNERDLLDPMSEAIDIKNIKIFYSKSENGEQVEVNNSQLDFTKGYQIIDPVNNNSGFYQIKVFLNTESINNDGISHTFIQWNSELKDTIRTVYDRSNSNLIAQDIYLNNKITTSNEFGVVTITK